MIDPAVHDEIRTASLGTTTPTFGEAAIAFLRCFDEVKDGADADLIRRIELDILRLLQRRKRRELGIYRGLPGGEG